MFDLMIAGNFACFTRPYTNSSPVSYEVLTPPAAQGILTAIYWHPGLIWQIHEISILNPIQYESILYNMPNFRAPTKEQQDTRITQLVRHLVLRNPAYRVLADLVTLDPQAIPINKAVGCATKRLEKGRHYFQPYMGLSDFAATVRFTDRDNLPQPQPIEQHLGQFPHFALYEPYDGKGEDTGIMRRPNRVGEVAATLHRRSTVYFDDAEIVNGVIKIPPIPTDRYQQLLAEATAS
jgi:CRISPR-associated protein Cas5d